MKVTLFLIENKETKDTSYAIKYRGVNELAVFDAEYGVLTCSPNFFDEIYTVINMKAEVNLTEVFAKFFK